MDSKKCTKCEQIKETIFFCKDSRNKDGYGAQCKDCRNKHVREYVANNKERTVERHRVYRANNKDKCSKATILWNKNNPDKVKENKQKYFNRHAERLNAKVKEWRQLNPDKVKEATQKWRDLNIEKVRGYKREDARRRPQAYKAVNVVNHAIRDGKLKRMPCEICGDSKSEAHHCDYSKPLEIQWLCKAHHVAWHRLFIPENTVQVDVPEVVV